jgi:DNA repair exonuclease SbcCD ATPase subunit
MIPKRVVLENFLSFGSPPQEIRFDQEPLWVLCGPNGVGKSAVFDAITYALFGAHRGGAQNAEQLVRHGANGFQVTLEFEFNGVDYRITRNRPLDGRPTHSIHRRVAPDEWRVEKLPAGKEPIRTWAVQTLGLDVDAFTSSVLLRQGQADRIISAGGKDRLDLLKKVIGAEHFEALSERVHEGTKGQKNRLDDLRTRRDGLPTVTEEALEAARVALENAEALRSEAHTLAIGTAERVTVAKQWADLSKEKQDTETRLREADERAADKQRIHESKTRLDELAATVPVLRQIINLRLNLAKMEKAHDERRAEQECVTAALTAQALRQEIDQCSKSIKSVNELSRFKAERNQFPSDLAEQLSAAQAKLRAASDDLTAAIAVRAEAEGLLRQAKSRQKEFDTVGVGVKCSRCGQLVTEEHAQRERDTIADEVRELQSRHADTLATEQNAKVSKKTAESEHEATSNLSQKQVTILAQLARLEQTLAQLGVTLDADELRRQVAAKESEAKQCEATAEALVRVDRKTLEQRRSEIDRKVRAEDQTIATDQGRLLTLSDRLSADWRARLDTLDAKAVESIDLERQRLESAKVADQFKLLQEDTARREEWLKQRDALAQKIDAIPEAARIPVAEAELAAAKARQTASDADTARDLAKQKADEVARLVEQCRQLVEEIRTAERSHDLHKKLDDLLGKDGLQRELVRSAEGEIVRLANDTVQSLSDGDLTIALEAEADCRDEAFALSIRRADDPAPIGVDYLSGSQKFRVAVSVALAIGRYAAGQARPLEAVIIDEGFGSLDKDGLRAAADELNRLRDHLRRIVLVSHQEEFAERFPVGYRLSRGENGTIATPFRR